MLEKAGGNPIPWNPGAFGGSFRCQSRAAARVRNAEAELEASQQGMASSSLDTAQESGPEAKGPSEGGIAPSGGWAVVMELTCAKAAHVSMPRRMTRSESAGDPCNNDDGLASFCFVRLCRGCDSQEME